MILIRQGADVLSAGSADAALEIVSSSKPDVVVSDIAMPNVDGHELMRRLRALAPGQGGRTPAIALTAFARSEDRTHALAAGFNMYASKPIDSAELVVSVASLAGRFAS